MRQVTYDDRTYTVRSNKTTLPDFATMERIEVLIWLNQNTYRRGHSNKRPNPLQGMGSAIRMDVR